MFDKKQFRIARFQVDLNYHVCFTYWSLKGVIAERWGHGPLFGAFTDAGNQVTLTPAIQQDGVPARVQGYYGIAASGFNYEDVTDREAAERDAVSWLDDVLTVLKPRRSIRLHVGWFGLYPVRDPAHASKLLRERFYNTTEVARLTPQNRFPVLHSAVDSFLVSGNQQLSLVIGVVGPPHKGVFFTTPDEARDSQWWMGVRMNTAIVDEDGIEEPITDLQRLLRESYGDFERAALTALPPLVG